MKDYQLYLVVLALVLIDIITMTTWQIVDPFYRETKQLLPMVRDSFHFSASNFPGLKTFCLRLATTTRSKSYPRLNTVDPTT